jgi:hypothetical protein
MKNLAFCQIFQIKCKALHVHSLLALLCIRAFCLLDTFAIYSWHGCKAEQNSSHGYFPTDFEYNCHFLNGFACFCMSVLPGASTPKAARSLRPWGFDSSRYVSLNKDYMYEVLLRCRLSLMIVIASQERREACLSIQRRLRLSSW